MTRFYFQKSNLTFLRLFLNVCNIQQLMPKLSCFYFFPSLDCLFKQLGAAQKGILWMQFVTSIYNDIT